MPTEPLHPTLARLLDVLAELPRAVLSGVYGIGLDVRGVPIPPDDMPPLDAAIIAWRTAGAPRPDHTPEGVR